MKLTGPLAAVIIAFLVVVGALLLFDKPTGAFIALGLAILAAFGVMIGGQAQVREHVNGNTTRMMDMMERDHELMKQLLGSVPPEVWAQVKVPTQETKNGSAPKA